MYKYLLIIIGSTQLVMALLGFFFPLRTFNMWRLWILNRFFPLHGFALICIGFPLTVYRGYLSSIIFYIGLFIVLTGPFVIIYPEKIRRAFDNSNDFFKERDIRIMIYLDALFRSGAGLIFLISCWKTFLS